jgi:hypothetical protein
MSVDFVHQIKQRIYIVFLTLNMDVFGLLPNCTALYPRLRMLERRVLNRVSGHEREQVTGGRRKLHIEDDEIKQGEMGRTYEMNGRYQNCM